MRIHVSNLAEEVTLALLREQFEKHGKVQSVIVLRSDESGQAASGFVEMPSHAEASNAVAALNSSDFLGRQIVLSLARDIGLEPEGTS